MLRRPTPAGRAIGSQDSGLTSRSRAAGNENNDEEKKKPLGRPRLQDCARPVPAIGAREPSSAAGAPSAVAADERSTATGT